jgi:hypothetical protein
MAPAAEYRESLQKESDPQEMAKWLKRQKALADRELRLDALRLSVADITESEVEEANP